LVSNADVAEGTEAGGLSAFNSDGFSLNGENTVYGSTNTSGQTYVTWAWDAGSSTETNENGSIISSVRANPSAGFSIVTYTGAGNTASTVGHGLGVSAQPDGRSMKEPIIFLPGILFRLPSPRIQP